MNLIKIRGSHFEVGYQLGEWGKVAFERVIVHTSLWKTITLLSHSKQVMVMQKMVQENYPNYWQELKGMAKGLACNFDELFAWNCRGDLVSSTSDGCTTVMSRLQDGTIIVAHNEDGYPSLRNLCAVAEISFNSDKGFISFVYPASLCGHTFAINHYGIVITVNNIRAVNRPCGIPRQILARASLDATTTDEAISILTKSVRSGAFHHTLANVRENRLVSVETVAEGYSIQDIDTHFFHSNHLIHPELSNIKQIITDSSKSRNDQLFSWIEKQKKEEINPENIISILNSQQDPFLPIYRSSPSDPDDENTLATALFTLNNKEINWQVFTEDRENPILYDKIAIQ